MIKKWEQFFSSRIYVSVICLYSFLLWSLRFIVGQDILLPVVLWSFIPLSLSFLTILIFFDKTVYTLPILLSIIFSIGLTNLNLDAFDYAYIGVINIGLIIAGFIAHIFKYRVKLRFNALGLGLLLVIVSFFMPFIYRPFSIDGLFISSISIVFFFIYMFYSNTLKGDNINYLFRTLYFVGLLLSFQLAALIIEFIVNFNGGIYDAIIHMMKYLNVNGPGWGNINDLTIHLVLFSAAIIYYLYKYPKKIFPWLTFGWFGLVIYLSFSRGSMITFGLLTLLIVGYLFATKDRSKLINLGYMAIVVCLLLILNINLINEMIDKFSTSLGGGWDNMLTGRVTLWWKHENSAIALFKQYPIFGYGWKTPFFFLSPGQNRITIYHSTFFHVLATGGIFGLLVLAFHWYQIALVFKKSNHKLAKYAILTTYIITQLHGLVDNTQYMFNYTISSLIMITILETSSKADSQLDVAYQTV